MLISMHIDHNGKLLFLIIIIAILQIVTIIIAILQIVIPFFLDRLKVAAKKNVDQSPGVAPHPSKIQQASVGVDAKRQMLKCLASSFAWSRQLPLKC